MSALDWEDILEIPRKGNDHDVIPPPPREVMQRRWLFRQGIREQTLQHRRIHRHGGMGTTGRSILLSLRDREVYGSKHCTLHGPKRRRNTDEDRPISGKDGEIQHVNGLGNHTSEGLQLREPRAAYPTRVHREIQVFAEYCSVIRYHSAFLRHLGGNDEVNEAGIRPSSSQAVSTISIAFSPDALTMASTHGDHTVKITSCSTGILLQTLEGHPRTPWTVKYHPLRSDVVASGCLGHQVRVWNWEEGSCLHMIRLDYAIISLSFHPTGHILAIACGSRLHFWDYDNYGKRDVNGQTNSTGGTRGALTEVEQRHMLRCVHFPPDGNKIIVGGMNPNHDDPRRPPRNRAATPGGGISFYLRLYDFDIGPALNPSFEMEERNSRGAIRLQQKLLFNPRMVIPRALLYNDGGFDVSPDGRVLCACAEFWLPEGVDNAMDLLRKLQIDHEEKMELDNAMAGGAGVAEETWQNGTNKREDGFPLSPAERRNQLIREQCQSPPRQRWQPGLAVAAPPPPRSAETMPLTPPNPTRAQLPLSPPSPPGRRWIGGLGQRNPNDSTSTGTSVAAAAAAAAVTAPPTSSTNPSTGSRPSSSVAPNPPIPPPPPPHPVTSGALSRQRQPHHLSVVAESSKYGPMTRQPGRYVPHVVTVSLETTPIAVSTQTEPTQQQRGNQMTLAALGHQPRLGQLLEACPLEGTRASAVTCVKFSPSADFCLLGYGVREPIASENGEETPYHPVTALYRVRGGMTHVSTMLSSEDDVNIARFHPDSGYGFVYGTKQGRVRMLSPRPWNFYN